MCTCTPFRSTQSCNTPAAVFLALPKQAPLLLHSTEVLCTPVTPAAILPVEKLVSNILALCNCYYFLSNTLQNMLRRNSKANDRHSNTPSGIHLFVLTAGMLPIYQNSTCKFNLTLIFQIVA